MSRPNFLFRMFFRNTKPVEIVVRPSSQSPEIVFTERGFYIRDKSFYLAKILELSNPKRK